LKVLGIVAEYNPFHNGHLYHLEESMRVTGATHSVAVMSGNFTLHSKQMGQGRNGDKGRC